ncbi:MAG: type II toxin-antitoxin system VapC family toxin [Deltaproteobacteria bacterium]|nr:type II toxin-antitoxin system VapC family toxin [Deltaproteobacteria bacterium]MBN2674801.1 type II toxin-antitoxin system VapC family toxin [Deltaproteobacteria bacterium]
MAVILDTCGLLSLAGVVNRSLSDITLERLRGEDEVFVSAISLFEIAIKHKKGALPLGRYSPRAFWETSVLQYALAVLPITDNIFLAAVELPNHHRDPSDRIIIAQSIAHKIDVVTYDEMFSLYGVSTID